MVETEAPFFQLHEAEFTKANYGEFAVIAGSAVQGFYPADVEAFLAG